MIQLEKNRLSQTHLVATPTSGRLPSGMEDFKTKSQHRLACTYQTRQCSILIFDGWFALPCLPTRGDIPNFGLHKSLFLPFRSPFWCETFYTCFLAQVRSSFGYADPSSQSTGWWSVQSRDVTAEAGGSGGAGGLTSCCRWPGHGLCWFQFASEVEGSRI